MDSSRPLYLVVSGAPTPEEVPELVTLLRTRGWNVTVVSTPMGTRFHDTEQLAAAAGEPVRVDFRMPGTGRRLQPPDCVLACPLTFASVNKFAQGIADTMAVALLCEMVGYGVPTVVVPKANPQLFAHPASQQSLETLRSIPPVTVLHEPDPLHEGRIPTWRETAEAVESAAGRR
ncbi:flavoprotein [Allosalinactinospora lopnorensis]|uniref:flavoprotein n=1 Tax=Allosalinactinospora lopnorensis TaxID=1352348 RepID=UPI000623F8DA|nr:flavoprotein [Allosalinactinospora lopnorensis]